MSSPSCLAHALTSRLQNSSLWGSRRSSLPGAQSECASVNTLRFIYPFQSGRFPRRLPPRTLTDAVTVSVVPRHRVGLRAVSCGTQSASKRAVGFHSPSALSECRLLHILADAESKKGEGGQRAQPR